MPFNEARARLPDLGGYPVTGAKLDQLEAAIAKYRMELTAPRGAIIARKAATSGLKEAFTAVGELLRLRLVRLVPLIAAEHPAFGVDYENARIIVNTR